MSINEKLKILIDHFEGGTVRRFAKKIDASHTAIAAMLPGSRESKPGFEIIEKILVAYPTVSVDWLIRDRGEMETIVMNKNEASVTYGSNVNSGNRFDGVKSSSNGGGGNKNEMIEFYKKEWESTKSELRECRKAVERKDKRIDELTNKINELTTRMLKT